MQVGGSRRSSCKKLLAVILSSQKWRRCTHFTQWAMWHAPSSINNTLYYCNNPLFSSSFNAMWYNHSVCAGWCSSTYPPLREMIAPHFGDDRINSRKFPTTWPPKYPDLNPCDFWLLGYLKTMFYCDSITSLSNLHENLDRQGLTFPNSCCFQLSNMLPDGSRQW